MQQWNKLSLFVCFQASNEQQLKSITEDFFANDKTFIGFWVYLTYTC